MVTLINHVRTTPEGLSSYYQLELPLLGIPLRSKLHGPTAVEVTWLTMINHD